MEARPATFVSGSGEGAKLLSVYQIGSVKMGNSVNSVANADGHGHENNLKPRYSPHCKIR